LTWGNEQRVGLGRLMFIFLSLLVFLSFSPPTGLSIYTSLSFTHTYRYTHARMHTRMHARMHARTHARAHARAHACTRTQVSLNPLKSFMYQLELYFFR